MTAPSIYALMSGLMVGCVVWIAGDARVLALARAYVGRLRTKRAAFGGPSARGAAPEPAGGLRGLVSRLVSRMRSRRPQVQVQARCLDELSELIDVVALGLAAGVSFDAALQIYCTRYDTMLSEYLGDALRSWKLGMSTRKEALVGLANRLDVPAFSMFVDTVTESLEFGAPLAAALTSQAESVRGARRAAVQEQIEKAPVKMLVPTGTLVLPAMLLAILGPLLASLSNVGL